MEQPYTSNPGIPQSAIGPVETVQAGRGLVFGPERRATEAYEFKAVARGVSRNIAACELTYRCREEIDYTEAMFQLEQYCNVLRKWDVDLMMIPGSDSYPDCCFVQDTAVVLDEVCVIASMGSSARVGEVTEVERLLSPLRRIRRSSRARRSRMP